MWHQAFDLRRWLSGGVDLGEMFRFRVQWASRRAPRLASRRNTRGGAAQDVPGSYAPWCLASRANSPDRGERANSQDKTANTDPKPARLSHCSLYAWIRLEGRGLDRALLRRNVKRFRGGLVFQAHRLLHHSTLGSRVIKTKEGLDRALALVDVVFLVLGRHGDQRLAQQV